MTVLNLMQDPNQLIRASALRVLSSIRVIVIAPIMMLAIKRGCDGHVALCEEDSCSCHTQTIQVRLNVCLFKINVLALHELPGTNFYLAGEKLVTK